MKHASVITTAAICLLLAAHLAAAQQPTPDETPQQQLQRLSIAVQQAQAQLEASQRQLLELQKSLADLQQRLGQPTTPPPDADIRERQDMQQSQIATLDQSKVESDSKYPVKVTGLILLNGFVNTSQVDVASAPTIAIAGGGSTGASLRQTILGVDARGPKLAGAASHADLRVDFFGSPATSTSSATSYADVGGLLRLRTAHATLDWNNTQAFVELDRPIVSPQSPTSLVAVAQPALAWSGNLWSWSPQLGVSHTLALSPAVHLALEAALIDAPDAPALASSAVDQAERSRWPGTELHLGLLGKQDDTGPSVGLGGYFSPHRTGGGTAYNAWAVTTDFRLPLPLDFELSGSLYRGAALGGLGGGAYKDYLFYSGQVIALDDAGGWAQLKKRIGNRLQFNAAFGLDNGYASQLREYDATSSTLYQNLARNQTFFANSIYSPSAYLLFSLEVRHIATIPVTGPAANSNIIGIAAAFKF